MNTSRQILLGAIDRMIGSGHEMSAREKLNKSIMEFGISNTKAALLGGLAGAVGVGGLVAKAKYIAEPRR